MATIIISPVLQEQEPVSEIVQLSIVVKNEDFDGFFDQLQVWKSRQGPSGPYEELTADVWRPARIPKLASDPPLSPVTGANVNIVGKALQLRVTEKDDIVVVFTGTDPLTYATVASQITTQGLQRLISYVTKEGEIAIQTTDAGTGAALRVVGGDAAAILGLPTTEPQSLAFGRDARIPLIRYQTVYSFTDVHGNSKYFYKTRFYNSGNTAVSEFSAPIGVGAAVGIQNPNLAAGFIDMVTADGKPIANQEVRLSIKFTGTLVEGRALAASDIIRRTDDNGHVEFVLVRGQEVVVAIIGTDLVRDIVVPLDQNIKVFNLLDPTISTQNDYFKARVPDIIFAERRTL